MKREIEFRVWDKVRKSFVPTEYISITADGNVENNSTENCFYDPQDWELIQFTGLRDSTKWDELTEDDREKWVMDGNMPSEWNGKKIFEWDRIQMTGGLPFYDNKGYVIFSNYSGSFVMKAKTDGGKGEDQQLFSLNNNNSLNGIKIKVVGNIFENPDPI